MEHLPYILAISLILMGVDWALIDGFRASLKAFRDIPRKLDYKYFLFPRIIVTITSGIMIYLCAETKLFGDYSVVLIFAAILVFFVTSLYPQAVMLFRSKTY